MTSLIPTGLPTGLLSGDETEILERLLAQLGEHQPGNESKAAYYAGEQRVRDLGISIPPHLRTILTVVGWPGTVVDVLEERLEHDGWTVPGERGDRGVSDIVEANRLQTEWSGAHLDSLIHGLSFGVTGAGGPDEPDPLVTLESPNRMTVTWDRRKRVVTEAVLVSRDDSGGLDGATLWVPPIGGNAGQVIELSHDDDRWRVEERTVNRLRLPPVVRLVNRPRLGDDRGRSEITPAVRGYTDNAVRTVLGMEVSREFFAAPMLWVLGANESAFVDRDGNPKTAWETYIGRIKAIEGGEDGQNPDVKQFAGSSPAPFIEQLRGLAQMLAAEAGIPTSYLGMVTDNPPSADSIRALESRLIKRTERRQATFGAEEGLLLRLAIWARDGEDPGVTPRPTWRDAATPTLAAAADATTKLVKEGVLPADSEVTQRRIGLSETDRRQLADERRRNRAQGTVSALAAAAEAARGDAEVVDLADRR